MVNISIGFVASILEADHSTFDSNGLHLDGLLGHLGDSTYDVLVISQFSDDEPPLVSLPFFAKLFLAMVILLSITSGSYYKSIMYRYVIVTNKQNSGWMHRPINVLILSSAIIHHFTHVTAGLWFLANVMSTIPLVDIVGFSFCEIIDVLGVFGLGHLTVGGLGIAVYRMLYIKKEYWVRYVIGEKRLLLFVMVTTHLFGIFLLTLFKLETSSDRFNLNMCRGLSGTDAQILIDYWISRKEPLLTTTHLRSTAVLACLAIQAFEFSLYLWFFHHRYKNDNETMKRILTHDVIRERNIKNVGTFLGQFYGFLMESTFLVLTILLIQFADENTHHIKALANVIKFADFGLLSAVEVYSSPGLRAFMNGKISK